VVYDSRTPTSPEGVV